MKISNRLGIIFPQMSENKPRYEYESWLLPFKPINKDLATPTVYKEPDSNYFEVKKAVKKQDEIRDSKNRRILSKEALLEDKSAQNPECISGPTNISSSSSGPGLSTPTSSSIAGSTNTPGPSTTPDPKPYPGVSSSPFPSFSPTADTSPVPKKKGRDGSQKSSREAKMNPLQRKLEKALATPVIMSKAESMMLKMGWSGGALGKTGGGIIEPVVPNLAYATSTKGFGQEPPSPKPIKKPAKSGKQSKNKADKAEKQLIRLEKRQRRLRVKMVFKENVMRYILDFVTNEREIAVLFDKSLHNGQRKLIHRIVQEIRELGESEVKSKTMNASNDRLLLLNIASKNRYVLQTQSEGDPPFRYLCLFKEAPESMYLVTHYKLNDKENDFVKREEKVHYTQYRTKSKKRKAERLLAKNARQLIDNNRSIDKEIKDKIVKEPFDAGTTPEIAEGSKNEIDCDIEKDSESETETVKTDEFNESDDEIIEGDDDVMEGINEQNRKTADIDEEIREIVKRTAAGACRITKNDEVLEIDETEQEIKNSRSENKNLKTNEGLVEDDNEYNVESEENIQHKDEETKPKTDSNEENPIKISISTSSRKEFMRYNLNMCFSDFIAGSAYKEFKFLGEFDEEEFEVLNEFLRDFFLVKDDKPAFDGGFMSVWNQAICKLRFKRDLNGGIV